MSLGQAVLVRSTRPRTESIPAFPVPPFAGKQPPFSGGCRRAADGRCLWFERRGDRQAPAQVPEPQARARGRTERWPCQVSQARSPGSQAPRPPGCLKTVAGVGMSCRCKGGGRGHDWAGGSQGRRGAMPAAADHLRPSLQVSMVRPSRRLVCCFNREPRLARRAGGLGGRTTGHLDGREGK